MSVAASLAIANQSATQQTMQMNFVKQQHEATTAIVDMIAEVSAAAPQPGQGTQVDTIA